MWIQLTARVSVARLGDAVSVGICVWHTVATVVARRRLLTESRDAYRQAGVERRHYDDRVLRRTADRQRLVRARFNASRLSVAAL